MDDLARRRSCPPSVDPTRIFRQLQKYLSGFRSKQGWVIRYCARCSDRPIDVQTGACWRCLGPSWRAIKRKRRSSTKPTMGTKSSAFFMVESGKVHGGLLHSYEKSLMEMNTSFWLNRASSLYKYLDTDSSGHDFLEFCLLCYSWIVYRPDSGLRVTDGVSWVRHTTPVANAAGIRCKTCRKECAIR